VGVVHRITHLHEQIQPLTQRHIARIAELGDGLALDVLHGEVRSAARGQPAIEDLGDARMVHHRECLALLLEACHHGLGVHARLHDLERDALHERLPPLREPDGAEAAFAEARDQLVGADLGTGSLVEAVWSLGTENDRVLRSHARRIRKSARASPPGWRCTARG
jgi:hypothetical protein